MITGNINREQIVNRDSVILPSQKKQMDNERIDRQLKAAKRTIKALNINPNEGKYYKARVCTGLAPYNTKAGTTYLIQKGVHGLAKRTKTGYTLYLTGKKDITNVKELEQFKHYQCRRWELSISGEVAIK